MSRRLWEGYEDTRATWRRLRAFRATPPVSPGRRELFNSALEQAEQQFDAAKRVGYASRALNLFYGLSQAGRAIAAVLAPSGTDPKLTGHGITAALDPLRSDGFMSITVLGQGRDSTSFQRLSNLLDSSSLPKQIPLRPIWNMILEVVLDHPQGTDVFEPKFVKSRYRGAPNEFTMNLTVAETENAAELAMSRYPELAGARFIAAGDDGRWGPNESTGEFPNPIVRFALDDWQSRFRIYRDHLVAMPAVGGSTQTLHPLLAWWAILFATSMATRYESVGWQRAIDINSSPLAVPLEQLLDSAVEAVPMLILSVVNQAVGVRP